MVEVQKSSFQTGFDVTVILQEEQMVKLICLDLDSFRVDIKTAVSMLGC